MNDGLIDVFAGLGDANWMDQSLCSQTDPEAFYPEKGGSTREAKAVCAKCLVRAECLDYALENKERYGIWGGLSERDRRKLERQFASATSQPDPIDLTTTSPRTSEPAAAHLEKGTAA